jgi:hypothetical protein
VCVAGVCQTRCPCRRCAAGESCFTDGRCRPATCATVSCPDGFYCSAGACRDACAGAACPGGGACARGVCQAPVVPDAGVRADAGLPPRDGGTIGFDGGVDDAGSDAGARDVATDRGEDAGGLLLLEDNGSNCVCSAPGARSGGRSSDGFIALAAGLMIGRARRRRRREGQP